MRTNAILLAALLLGSAVAFSRAESPVIPEFVFALEAVGPGTARDHANISVARDATVGYDRGLDQPSPPPPPGGPWLDMYVLGPDGQALQQEADPSSSDISATIHLDVEGPPGVVVVTWSARALDVIPRSFGIDVILDGVARDARESSSLTVEKPDEGLFARTIEVRIYPLSGSAPSAPRDIVAASSYRRVDVNWLAPADDGGHPILHYDVFREAGSVLEFVGRVDATSFTDPDVAFGAFYRYHVAAINRRGDGPANASGTVLGLGRLPVLEPRSGGPETVTTLLDERVSIPSLDIETPGGRFDLMSARTGSTVEDPNRYFVEVEVLGQPSNRLTILTPIPIGAREDVALADIPQAHATTPGAAGHLVVRERTGANGPESMILEWDGSGSLEGFDDGFEAPLTP